MKKSELKSHETAPLTKRAKRPKCKFKFFATISVHMKKDMLPFQALAWQRDILNIGVLKYYAYKLVMYLYFNGTINSF